MDIIDVEWVTQCREKNTRVNADNYLCNELVQCLMEEKERMIKDDMLPFGLMDDGREEENINNTMEVFHDHDDYNKIW